MKQGSLFLVGGKDGRNKRRDLIERFVALCGGASASVLVITSASKTPERHRKEYNKSFLASGVRDVAVFHAEERAAAEDPDLLRSLDRADGVYFTGGGQRRLVDAMGGTRFEERLRRRHGRGLHVGGTSAGASAMSAVMIAEGKGHAVELSEGFGLLKEIIVDQHLTERGRLSRLVAAVSLRPAMLGFGLDEGTAVRIDPSGRAEVFGKGALTVVDGPRVSVLTEGWRYELTTRTARPPGRVVRSPA